MRKKTKRRVTRAKDNTRKNRNSKCGLGSGYFLGFIGSAVYYISTASGFWMGVWGVVKSLVWPAFLVYELMKSLGM